MLSSSLVLVGLVSLACATPLSQQQQQQPFFSSHKPVVALTDEHDDLLFVQSQPVDSSFTYHITHEKFPGHQVRIREPNLCDSVQEWSGYLDARGRHFYFWSYESRNDPTADPVMLWLNGGPGCSSFTGMLQELGPCSISRPFADQPPLIQHNPHSWNNNATVIFLDQPAGVGYSYADEGVPFISGTDQAAIDVHAFLTIWFSTFNKKFGKSDFHMAGESFAGRYIPVFADYIVEQNKLAAPEHKINLASVLIGNGFTHPTIQYASYFPTVCSSAGGYGPYLNDSTCHAMYTAIPECQRLSEVCANDISNTKACVKAAEFCEDTQTGAFYASGRSAYDVDHYGDYAEEKWIHNYLNRADVKHELGVDHEAHGGVKEFIGCNDKVGEDFAATGDGAKPSYHHVAHLLENGVRTLIYAGARDFICNALGNEAWTLQLEWAGQHEFRKQALQPWHVKGDGRAGLFRTHGNFTFATVDASGHFVPYDQPRRSAAMATAWLHNGPDALKQMQMKG